MKLRETTSKQESWPLKIQNVNDTCRWEVDIQE